jgi:AcrR family transcriptional regulator
VGRTAVYNHFPDKESVLIGYIAHETEQYVHRLESALGNAPDPIEELRIYVRQMISVARPFHLMRRSDLRCVLPRGTIMRLREHAEVVDVRLHRILSQGMAAGVFADLDIEPTIRLINACVFAKLVPEEPAAQARTIAAAERFILQAVSVRTAG